VWIGLFTLAGYYFGHLPVVRENLVAVMMGIIVVSVTPGMIAWLRHRFAQ
jgi:membrane-associated protein